MATTYIGGSPPTNGVISVTAGCGRRFALQSTDVNGDPVTFTATVSMTIDIDPATTVDAAMDDDLATLVIEPEVCDQVTNQTTWQIYMATTPPTPLLVGRFERHDK